MVGSIPISKPLNQSRKQKQDFDFERLDQDVYLFWSMVYLSLDLRKEVQRPRINKPLNSDEATKNTKTRLLRKHFFSSQPIRLLVKCFSAFFFPPFWINLFFGSFFFPEKAVTSKKGDSSKKKKKVFFRSFSMARYTKTWKELLGCWMGGVLNK